jgi:hypothetical protein
MVGLDIAVFCSSSFRTTNDVRVKHELDGLDSGRFPGRRGQYPRPEDLSRKQRLFRIGPYRILLFNNINHLAMC